MSLLASFRRRALGPIGAAVAAMVVLPSAASIPARTSGVAPLYVFFDATGTTSSETSRPFHDIEYRWTFGETSGPGIGTWARGSRAGVASRNAAYGPVAGHVFETPGTYTVTVSAWYGGVATTRDMTITVQDPAVVFSGANTICYSTSGTFTGAPAGSDNRTSSSFNTIVAAVATGKRVLLRAGESFVVDTSTPSITANGPWTLGSFGSGANPVVTAGAGIASGSFFLAFSSASTPTISDGRVMDLDFDATSREAGFMEGFGSSGSIHQLLILRHTSTKMRLALDFSAFTLDFWNGDGNPAHSGHTVWDQLAVVDCTATNHAVGTVGDTATHSYGIYCAAERGFFVGNDIDNGGGSTITTEHNIRLTYGAKVILSNNTLTGPGAAKHCFKIHANSWGSTGVEGVSALGAGYTRWLVVSENKLEPDYGAFAVVIGNASTDAGEDLRGKDVLFERNWIVEGPGVQVAYWAAWPDTTIRNNLVNASNGLYGEIFRCDRRGVGSLPVDNVQVYNNSMYSSKAGASFWGVFVGSTTKNAVIKNNVAYAPNDTLHLMVQGTGDASFPAVASNNSSTAQILSTDPLFSGVLTSVDGWKITNAGSYTRGAGADVPVWSDFFGGTRSAGSVDIGASEQ